MCRWRTWAVGLTATLGIAACAPVPIAPVANPRPQDAPAPAGASPSASESPFRTAAEDPEDGPCIIAAHRCIALNPDVDESTIDSTICRPGYTKSVRPATSYTNG